MPSVITGKTSRITSDRSNLARAVRGVQSKQVAFFLQFNISFGGASCVGRMRGDRPFGGETRSEQLKDMRRDRPLEQRFFSFGGLLPPGNQVK